jgi:hypothetical protein
MQKAEAVHVMQRYEASLSHSSAAVAPGGSTNPEQGHADPATTASAEYVGPGAGGMAWSRLVNPGQLALGGKAGEFTGVGSLSASAASAEQLAAQELAAGRAAEGGAMPTAGASRRDENATHQSKLPVLDQELFEVDDLGQTVAPPVIGV